MQGESALERTCVPAAGTTGSPAGIEEAVALINGLPRPTSVACLLESLDRPLAIEAAESKFSAQPAVGRRSPRIFIFNEPLIISIVPEGIGAHLVEFSELDGQGRSVKAELEFPVRRTLDVEDPFEHVTLGTATSCSACHANERPARQVGSTMAFASDALRPEDNELVSIEELRTEAETCNPVLEAERCAVLSALFSFGDLETHHFPQELRTF